MYDQKLSDRFIRHLCFQIELLKSMTDHRFDMLVLSLKTKQAEAVVFHIGCKIQDDSQT